MKTNIDMIRKDRSQLLVGMRDIENQLEQL